MVQHCYFEPLTPLMVACLLNHVRNKKNIVTFVKIWMHPFYSTLPSTWGKTVLPPLKSCVESRDIVPTVLSDSQRHLLFIPLRRSCRSSALLIWAVSPWQHREPWAKGSLRQVLPNADNSEMSLWYLWGADHMKISSSPWVQTDLVPLPICSWDVIFVLILFGRTCSTRWGGYHWGFPPFHQQLFLLIQSHLPSESQAMTRLVVFLECLLTRCKWNWMEECNFKWKCGNLRYDIHTVLFKKEKLSHVSIPCSGVLPQPILKGWFACAGLLCSSDVWRIAIMQIYLDWYFFWKVFKFGS